MQWCADSIPLIWGKVKASWNFIIGTVINCLACYHLGFTVTGTLFATPDIFLFIQGNFLFSCVPNLHCSSSSLQSPKTNRYGVEVAAAANSPQIDAEVYLVGPEDEKAKVGSILIPPLRTGENRRYTLVLSPQSQFRNHRIEVVIDGTRLELPRDYRKY